MRHQKSSTTRCRPTRTASSTKSHVHKICYHSRSPTNGNLTSCVVILRGSWLVLIEFLLALRARNAFMQKFWTTIKSRTRYMMPNFVYRVISTKLIPLPGLKVLHTAICDVRKMNPRKKCHEFRSLQAEYDSIRLMGAIALF